MSMSERAPQNPDALGQTASMHSAIGHTLRPGVPGVVYWFRADLRLHDQPALSHAVEWAKQRGVWLLPVFVHDPELKIDSAWGFPRTHPRRLTWTAMAVQGLSGRLHALGSELLELSGRPEQALQTLVQQLGGPIVVCEEIPAPEEQAQVQRLRELGVDVYPLWPSTLIAPQDLPFAPSAMPDQFTRFRQAVERQGVRVRPPLPAVQNLPALPPRERYAALGSSRPLATVTGNSSAQHAVDTCFDMTSPRFHGSERAALAHVEQYCRRGLPHHYKQTRNGLMGVDYSTKWSPWLATGALSPRQAWASVAAFEAEQGANEGTYWIFFELLWRDYFRWLHVKHGRRLYRARGLSELPAPSHDPHAFQRWCEGRTGQVFIDAGMRELATTGYLSNRMRQNVASYLIHDLQGDWRAGAAWFESQLLDFDVFSNQGNWLYLSGRGTDPRPSRRFNPEKQAQDYDPQGLYRTFWAGM